MIYGVDGVLVPEEAIFPFDSETLTQYLIETLMPGSAEVPLSLVVDAVNAGQTNAVAQAALSAIHNGYLQQLTALYQQASGNQQALLALSAVADSAIKMSSCATVTPLNRQLPSAAELKATPATQAEVARRYPEVVQCASQSK